MNEVLHILWEALLDALIDTAKLLPFLYLSYLLIEFLEHHGSEKAEKWIAGAGKAGPGIGALLGLVPQCGFSGAAASLYCAGTISLGTLLAVFLSTSDEMLPLLLSGGAEGLSILKLLGCKCLFAALCGFAIDLLYRRKQSVDHIHELCEKEHCACEGHSLFLAALIHTAKIAGLILLVSFGLNIVFSYWEIGGIFTGIPVVGEALAGLLGLIPNCAVSVLLTQLYLTGAIPATVLLSGLFVNAGVGLLVLLRQNTLKRSLPVVALLYVLGLAGGLLCGLVF